MQTFEQRVAKGEMFKSILLVPFIIISGINLLNHNLRYGGVRWYSNTKENQKDLYVAIQEMFPIIADQKDTEVEALTMKYHQYKRNYVKHISFNPTNENLSKWFLRLSVLFFQRLHWSIHHWRRCSFSLMRLHTMRLKETKRWSFIDSTKCKSMSKLMYGSYVLNFHIVQYFPWTYLSDPGPIIVYPHQ